MLKAIKSIRSTAVRIAAMALTLVMLSAVLPMQALAEYKMPYYIEVDITNQIVTVYNTQDGSIARQMLTSSGANGATPLGTYKLYGKVKEDERSEWMYLGKYRAWVHYVTRIQGPYLFHSLPYDQKDESTLQQEAYETFGMPTSHGCMRLRTEDAKFIAEKCLRGTAVKIYESGKKDEPLRALLMKSSFTGENGMTYAEFQGIAEGELGRGSSGDAVIDLQHRLGDLGYYNAEPDGKFDANTAIAVAAAQEALGMDATGACSNALYEILFSESAPTSAAYVTVEEGRSGPAVENMQQALYKIGLYNGDMDGIYDLDVIEAVKRFQAACGYTADGIATPSVQQALYYQVEQLEALFGEDMIPQPETVEEEVNMAKVSAELKIIIRSKASTGSKELGKVKDGDTVLLLGVEDSWAHVYVNNTSGYMRKKYLEPYTEINSILKYSANGSEYTIGHTLQEYAEGAQRFATEFQSISAQTAETAVAEEILIATVNTGSEDVLLNLRAQADSAAEVLTQIPNGTAMRVMEQGEEWTQVTYGSSIGYLMNEYLLISEGTMADLGGEDEAIAADEPAPQSIPAKVASGSGAGGKVYEAASKDAKVLGSLKNGTEVSAIDAVGDTWIKISYEGREGYMLKKDLQRMDQ